MRKFITTFVCFAKIALVLSYGYEPYKGYRAYVDTAIGDAYNFNTAQTISTNNMQLYSMLSTTHGYALKSWFLGGGVGYYHSFRDRENMYPVYTAGRYTFDSVRMKPYVETRAGIICDPRWVRPIQAYGAIKAGFNVYNRWQAGLSLSMFSRPSRYFTANAELVLSYAFAYR